jgi:ATP-dependent DNA helicase RecG
MSNKMEAVREKGWGSDSDLVQQPESETFERLARPVAATVGRTVCAFLNGTGGRILIGVEVDGRVLGVKEPEAAVAKLRKELFALLKPTASFLVTQLEIQDKALLLVEVAPGADGPYAYKSSIYTRKGEDTRVASPVEVRSLVRQLEDTPRWEAQTSLQVGIHDLDLQELRRTADDVYRRRFEQLPSEPERMLDSLYLVRGGLLSNAAVVLFAQEPARFLPQTRIRAVHFADESQEELLDNQVFSGHIFKLYELLEGFLQKNLAVKASLTEAVRGARAEQTTYPAAALREALWNALIHRDYSRSEGSIRLSLFQKRLEIWNSGGLPEGIKVSDIKTGGISQLRNPDIAHVLMLRGQIERMGIGGRRIVEACRMAGLPTPKWEERGGGTQITFYLAEGKSVVSLGTDRISPKQLNPRVLSFLETLTSGQRFTAREYQQSAGAEVSERQGRLDLGQMLKADVVERRGSGHHTHYIRTEEPL